MELQTSTGNMFNLDHVDPSSASSKILAQGYIGTIVEVTKEFKFEAAHFIPEHVAACKYLHGHSYKLFVSVTGPIKEDGMVMDFKDLDAIVSNLIDKYDHAFLNDFYDRPTAEVMASAILQSVNEALTSPLYCTKVTLYETVKCCATVRKAYPYE